MSAAFGASMVIRWPLPRLITARLTSGLLSASAGVPGVAGIMPSAAHTYSDDSAPLSSLPGSPSGAVVNSSVSNRRATSWVFHGWPT